MNNFIRIIILYLVIPLPVVAQDNDNGSLTELEVVRNQIKEVESSIKKAREESEALLTELQLSEKLIVDTSINLERLNIEMNEGLNKLTQLNERKTSNEENLSIERTLFANQVRAAYQTGRHDYIKLLLNQEKPEIVGRMLVYYSYYNKARAERISNINETILEIDRLKLEIQSETTNLSQLRNEQEVKLEDINNTRLYRKEIVAKLDSYITEQDVQLTNLLQNAEELEALVDEIRQQDSIVNTFEDIPPFSTLKGQLSWPVNGKITSKYGASRKDGKLKWQGVNITADKGTEVRAVSPGRVVFADWFRNLGLLIILDHGGGYMSLYGHNERLLKKEGDWVISEEEIGRVGDTGGQASSSLYFEIRQNGDPVNPDMWCKI
jgi:septal ring factor EnvC (AmiA/AmiB activator)